MKLLSIHMDGASVSLAWLARALDTPWVLGIAFCEIASFVLWMRILATVNISRAVPLTAIAYVLILLMGWYGFHEPMLPLQIIGSCLILVGVSLIGTSDSSANQA
jgi:drug/metabolite transporter (DMT)-like permease